jgi:iron complex outermembrane recepter protein
MRNRVVAGLDYFNRQVIDNSSGYVANGNVYIGNAGLQNVNESVFGIFNPSAYITSNDSGRLSTSATDNLLANARLNNNTTREDIYSAYVSNVLNFSPKLSVMASLRIDQFESDR